MKTVKKTVTLAEYLKYMEAQVKAMGEEPDKERFALMQAAQKAAEGVTDPEATFEIEVPEETEKSSVDLTEVNAKLDSLVESVKSLTGNAASDEELMAKQSLAVQLAVELLDVHLKSLGDLREKLNSEDESLDRDAVWDAFMGSWDVENAVDTAMTALGKSDEEMSKLFKAKLAEKFSKKEEGEEAGEGKKEDEPGAKGEGEEGTPTPDVNKEEITCGECGAKMAGEICDECGWKKGTEPKEKSAKPTHKHPTRYRKQKKD